MKPGIGALMGTETAPRDFCLNYSKSVHEWSIQLRYESDSAEKKRREHFTGRPPPLRKEEALREIKEGDEGTYTEIMTHYRHKKDLSITTFVDDISQITAIEGRSREEKKRVSVQQKQ